VCTVHLVYSFYFKQQCTVRFLCPELFIKKRLIRLTVRTLSLSLVVFKSWFWGSAWDVALRHSMKAFRTLKMRPARCVSKYRPPMIQWSIATSQRCGHLIHLFKSRSTSTIIILFSRYNLFKSLHQNLHSIQSWNVVSAQHRLAVPTCGAHWYFEEKSGNLHTMMMMMQFHWRMFCYTLVQNN
jgi:hypothetical protein